MNTLLFMSYWIYAFELLQDGGFCHIGTHTTKQNDHTSHAVYYEMCDHPRMNGNLCM